MTAGGPTGGALARVGFSDVRRAGGMLQELSAALPDLDGARLVRDLGMVADPDLALLTLVRLREAAPDLGDLISTASTQRERLVALLGASTALGDHLIHHPEQVREVTDPKSRAQRAGRSAQRAVTERMFETVGDRTGREAMDALRVGYHRELAEIAVEDLAAEDATAELPAVAAALADLAGAALEVAVQLARDEEPESEGVRFSVIAMGKTGGRELNYISDVDVIFLAGADDEADEERALRVGARLATAVIRICGQSTAEGSLWPVDAALRPEGKQGPLVRSLASHREYYQRWAKTWEFQALLKARHVAGDETLSREWLDVVEPLVWSASSRDGFVDEVQAMRRRVEQNVPKAEADRQLKLGPGGLRDIEFSVQLLELVHGRADETLRSETTLEALAALRDGGYVGRDDAAALDSAYRLLRVLEHRIQLYRLRRTHLMPTSEAELRRLGRSLGERRDAATAIVQRWRGQQREVRRLHERLFYRPLLSAVARLSTDEVRLSTDAAKDRLGALGFRDPAGAVRHLESLTEGVSRRATIQRHLLPVMLGWFADGADPDAGLLAFRQISDTLGTTHWYLRMLRDEGSAAERLAHVLSSSRYAVDLLIRSPEAVVLLGDPKGLSRVDPETLRTRLVSAAGRHEGAAEAFQAVRTVRARELLRVVLADLVGELDDAQVRASLTALTDALLEAGLAVATRAVVGDEDPLVRMMVVGMGRLGGAELGYASDADVMYVYEPVVEGTEGAAEQALAIVTELRKGLTGSGPDPAIELDATLRPEGKSGPLVRSLESYRAYYDRWSAGWESQALLRARPVAGDADLARRFTELIEPLRWPEGGIDARAVREVRRLKARMEAERLPRGADPRTHFKLGLGGLSDVEWVVQLHQLRHAHELPGLRTTRTLDALQALEEAGLVEAADAAVLRRSWVLASRLRDVGVLWRGRPVDSVPSHLRDAEGISRILGRAPGLGSKLAEEWRRTARRARQVVERLFYETAPVPAASPRRSDPRRS
ncbi:bifunctional [glutamine synthetase] adenylyltransferase/[glutamine synthetase]-adenylyl-L-tyrosine phosphorylase [Ornithinicoccus hortensis]|uniref:Bifunctional glutamine synthetase adenylyltransferase/adenylyl-removing enzyme n=1 Tax=Ornithinicoccus hortensis TaxID=82346 RepID=A0A542YSQ2_9MICO|nr:bifunctional [glutamine synthetase] adenylyltransferase/[glutamine synthetase]-adenylyl-L-tyrosine phosphorylase [Ornithinicoccus hortensis]TQL50974.1 glutamate-ammonia-ligase adenylyltransferase [Ornithinicoccus hortensis]